MVGAIVNIVSYADDMVKTNYYYLRQVKKLSPQSPWNIYVMRLSEGCLVLPLALGHRNLYNDDNMEREIGALAVRCNYVGHILDTKFRML